MIKGLAITPPVLGRISIGQTIERNGKRLPSKDDQFTITSQIQTKEGWIPHPLDEELRKRSATGKLRSIPVSVLFNEPDLNLRAEYSLFDRSTGRPLCVGNGETCRRDTESGVQTFPCPSPDGCELARGGACKPYGRFNVKIGDEDDFGTFIFRTTGYNSIRTLAARMHYFKAISGDLLASLPLELRLRGKSTALSRGTPIYYVDLTIREGMTLEEALTEAQETHQQREVLGYRQHALDAAAREGFANGSFEDSVEESLNLIQEFYPTEESNAIAAKEKPSLNDKLTKLASEVEVAVS